jgi:hypothetical protein
LGGGAGYRRIAPWTNDILVAARRVYEATGLRLAAFEPHRSFGKASAGETWGKDLLGAKPARGRPAAPANVAEKLASPRLPV